ncbi:MAG: hypothetical protein C0594_17010 [Marinilabiliales bacterium]|nr:MAG: hypothetical protein C0594_17010 [Marinilabiliales bacterium]
MLAKRSVKDNKELLEKSFKPFYTMLFIKLGKIDSFFSSTEFTFQNTKLEYSLDEFLIKFGDLLFKNENSFQTNFSFKSFNKKESKVFDLDVNVNLNIEPRQYVFTSNINEEPILIDKISNELSTFAAEVSANLILKAILRKIDKQLNN